MEYKIISGPVTEIRRGWMPTKRGGQRVRRGTKAKKSSIEKIKRNETDAIKKLTRVLNCNFRMGDLWLTLTFPGKEEINWETAQTAFDRFLRKLRESYRKEQGANIKFVYSQGRKDEDGNDARPHFHLVMPAADYELVCALWPQEAVTYRRLDGRKDHVKIAEYMIRNAKGVPGKKKYHTSRGLEKPVYREANREVFGAEYALRTYNADVYDKARAAYAKGVSYDTYYDYYFATKEMHADKDENGKSISGSKKAKVVEYINSLDIPPEQKDALYVAAGYTAKSARNQKWNGGSGGSGGRRGRGKRTALKAPTPKAPEIIIPKSGTASSAKAGGTSKTPKVSGNVIADFTKTASGTDIQKAVTQAKRKALKAGNRTVYVEEGSPIDYFLKYGKLPSLK